MDGVKHYFINSHDLEDEVTSARFEREGLEVLENEFRDKDVVILVGGSGMFIDALCLGLDDIPTDPKIRADVQQIPLDELLTELYAGDPGYFETVDRENATRVQRAVEVLRVTGKPYSSFRSGQPKERPFAVHRFVLDHDRTVLYKRINQRVEQMLADGLENEVRAVEHLRHLSSMNTVGYKELFAYFDATCSRDEAISMIKQNSRRYAKRQLTWLRRHPESHWIPFTNLSAVVQNILTIFVASRTDV